MTEHPSTLNSQPQLELDWKAPADPAEIDQLIALLAAAGTWLTAKDIELQLGWSDRKTRRLASQSHGLIISGNSGYKHNRHATPEEVNEFSVRMLSQGKEMIKRGLLTKRKHHQLVG